MTKRFLKLLLTSEKFQEIRLRLKISDLFLVKLDLFKASTMKISLLAILLSLNSFIHASPVELTKNPMNMKKSKKQ